MPDNPFAAILAQIRERFDTVTGIPLEALPLAPEQAAAFAAMVMDIPALLAAVEAVLELHQPADRGTGAQCEGCATHVTFTRWPCPTYRAITAALAGKEAGDEH